MFSYTGLTPTQVQALKEKYHVYLIKSGRASISGCKLSPLPHPSILISTRTPTNPLPPFSTVSQKNVGYVAKAFDDIVRNVK